MPDNLLLGPDAQCRFSLQVLKAHQGHGSIGEHSEVIPGVFFSNDPTSKVRGNYDTSEGKMLSFQLAPRSAQKPAWQALHFAMGAADFSETSVLGVVVRSTAPSSTTTKLCLRSGRDNRFEDKFFRKTIVSFSEPSTHIDVLELYSASDIPKIAEWREIIFFFRPGEVSMDFLDIRIFAV